ncbi:hypothetical protein DENSPDRAFT_57930 [Dentipellis sp. KUC8613]|nr:hypothetical protein DENSPDRAFT_57930 [Dentipellis sp. KUC8613]
MEPSGKADFLSTTPTTPVHLLKSGWDDELNIKTSDLKTQRSASTFSSGLGSPISPEEEFAVSTLHYLESNAARQLRLPSPPPTAHPAGLPSPVSPTDKTPDTMLAPPRTSIDSASPSVSRGNSILSSAAWPEPPRSIPSPTDGRLHLPRSPTRATQSPTLSRSGSQSSVRSMSAGRLDASGYPMLPNARPAHFRDVPFNGPGVMPLSSPPPPRRNASSASAKAKAMARVHVRPLSPVGKRTRNASDEVIYMTVVHESQ